MPKNLTDSRLANLGAGAISEAFVSYRSRFDAITLRAQNSFKALDWQGMRADAAARLDVYKSEVDKIETRIRHLWGHRIDDKQLWSHTRAVYADRVIHRDDRELAETFFNSVTRRIFATVGVDPQIEFVDSDGDTRSPVAKSKAYRSYPGGKSTVDLICKILADYRLTAEFQNLERDAGLVAGKIEGQLHKMGLPVGIDRIEMAENVFYRGMGAYLIGRIFCDQKLVPLAIALLNSPEGIAVDAVLLQENDISILFSFTRSHFHVDSARPYDLIGFLKTILPHKRTAELYIAIGFHKHGKTELYREIRDKLLQCSDEQFEISRGQRGLVMIVFNMPNDDLVFKLIRDRFGTPKHTTQQQVMERYNLVFKHDRAGRLIDAHAFEHLEFDECFFSPNLLAQLQSEAAQTVKIKEGHVILTHAYVERRVTPFDVYLQEADPAAARNAVIDFGVAIKDLAASNIFPGDILTKNFGVTRHGRIVFYDYDELCPLTACNFRKFPQSAHYDDELASEPWYHVDENDVFPEEFKKFLGLPEPLLQIFLERHSDLFEVDFWHQAQKAIEAGELPHIFPYAPGRRLNRPRMNP